MWIVQLALRRPYTFIVAALLLLIVSPLVILRTPTDIFPNINIPVVSIVWQYTGMPPTEFAGRITSVYERALTTTFNDIEHIESQSFNGVGVIKVFFQPSAKLEAALAQVTAIPQTITRQTPVGVTPPLVISSRASAPKTASSPTLPTLRKHNDTSESLDINPFRRGHSSCKRVIRLLDAFQSAFRASEIGRDRPKTAVKMSERTILRVGKLYRI